jgi:hypothetical protein
MAAHRYMTVAVQFLIWECFQFSPLVLCSAEYVDCSGQGNPPSSEGTLLPDFQANTWSMLFSSKPTSSEESGRRLEGNSGIVSLKGQCHEILTSGFFHESVSPKPLSIPVGPFQIFRKFAEIFSVQSKPQRWQMEKIFNQKNFNYFVWTPLGWRVNMYINFFLQVHFKVSPAWYCSHYLSPVSLIQVALCPQRRWHQRQPLLSLTSVANKNGSKSFFF